MTELLALLLACAEDPAPVDAAEAPASCPALGPPDDTVRYVDPAAAEGGDGAPDRPFADLQAALDAVSGPTELRLAAGDYTGVLRVDDPVRHAGLGIRGCEPGAVALLGNLALRGTPDAALEGVTLQDLAVAGGLAITYTHTLTLTDLAVTGAADVLTLTESTATMRGTTSVTSTGDTTSAVLVDSGALRLAGDLEIDGGVNGLAVIGGARFVQDADTVLHVHDTANVAVGVAWDATATFGAVELDGDGVYGGIVRDADATFTGPVTVGGGYTARGLMVLGERRAATLTGTTEASFDLRPVGDAALCVIGEATAWLDGPVEVADATVGLWAEAGGTIDARGPVTGTALSNVVQAGESGTITVADGTGEDLLSTALLAHGGSLTITGAWDVRRGTVAARGTVGDGGEPAYLRVSGSVDADTTASCAFVSGGEGVTFVNAGVLSSSRSTSCGAFANTGGRWITEAGGTLTVTGAGSSGAAVESGGEMTLGDVSVDGAGGYGLSVLDGTLRLEGAVTATGTTGGGVVVTGPTYPATLTVAGDLRVTETASSGLKVYPGGTATVVAGGSLRVEEAVSTGVWVPGGVLTSEAGSSIEVVGTDGNGVYAPGGTVDLAGSLAVEGAALPCVATNAGGSLVLRGATLTGCPGVAVWTIEATADIADVRIVDAEYIGVAAEAPTTPLRLTDVTVDGADLALLLDGGTGTWTGGTITGCSTAVIQQNCGGAPDVVLDGVVIRGNADDAVYTCASGVTRTPP